MKVHLEGMGVMGALTAFLLDYHGIDFTWHDIDLPDVPTPFTAWRASTGAIFPTGKQNDMDGLSWFHDAINKVYRSDIFSVNDWVYGSVKAPHGASGETRLIVEHLKVAKDKCINCNPQRLVETARSGFAASRVSTSEGLAKKGAKHTKYFISHGWSERQTHVYWGWNRLVKLEVDPRLHPRSCFYFRKDRFFITYAYPAGHTGWWYAGSTITKQKRPMSKPERLPKVYATWESNFHELTKGLVTVKETGPFTEGWRPASSGMHDSDPVHMKVLENQENVFQYPCCSHGGIRNFPEIASQVLQILRGKA